jgi:hypothetical protein
MRNQTDKCLLCWINPAVQKNSHILPRFLKKVIYHNNPKKHAILYRSNNTQIPVQDIPKEDYILCPICEKRFASLETYISRELYKMEKFSSGYNDPIIKISGNRYKILNHIRSDMLALFSYSLAWRMHISNHELFKRFTLSPTVEIKIREILNQFLYPQEINFRLNEKLKNLPFPYLFVKPDKIKDATWMIYYNGSPNNHIWFICALSYFVVILDDETKIPTDLIPTLNYKLDPPKIKLMCKEDWQKVIDNMIDDFRATNIK